MSSPNWLFGTTLLVALALVGVSALGCAATPLGASETGISTATQSEPRGAQVFERECASCHGRRGEGLGAAPNIMGPGALPVYARDPSTAGAVTNYAEAQQQQDRLNTAGEPHRQPFKTAQDVFDYVSRHMPLPQAKSGSLPREDYWAVVNFLLVGHGVAVPKEGVTEQNAGSIDMTRR